MAIAETRTAGIVLPPGSNEGVLGLPARPPHKIARCSGGSRLGPRNKFVAQGQQGAGLATVRFSLLSNQRSASRSNVFDTGLSADWLTRTAAPLHATPPGRDLPVSYSSIGTDAEAALLPTPSRSAVRAVISCHGRPGLAGDVLPDATMPLLLTIDGHNTGVLAPNRAAYRHLLCQRRPSVVSATTRLFDEPGPLEAVVTLAGDWFLQQLTNRHVTEQI